MAERRAGYIKEHYKCRFPELEGTVTEIRCSKCNRKTQPELVCRRCLYDPIAKKFPDDEIFLKKKEEDHRQGTNEQRQEQALPRHPTIRVSIVSGVSKVTHRVKSWLKARVR
jgi:hypothetical protein